MVILKAHWLVHCIRTEEGVGNTLVALLERQLATERAEKALAIESNRLYEEEVGLLRDALPSGLFGHVGSFVRGLGTGVAAGAFISKL